MLIQSTFYPFEKKAQFTFENMTDFSQLTPNTFNSTFAYTSFGSNTLEVELTSAVNNNPVLASLLVWKTSGQALRLKFYLSVITADGLRVDVLDSRMKILITNIDQSMSLSNLDLSSNSLTEQSVSVVGPNAYLSARYSK